VNKADFIDWKQHPVTQVIFGQLEHRIRSLQETLGGSAGIDPLQDRLFVGAIQAYTDMLNPEWEEEQVND
jgi:hypothetical protein